MQICTRACANAFTCVCARARANACMCVCRSGPAGAAGTPGAGWLCPQGIVSWAFLALPGTPARGQVAVPLSPASLGTKLGVSSLTGTVRGRGGPGPACDVRKVEAPAQGLPRPQGAREGGLGAQSKVRRPPAAPGHPVGARDDHARPWRWPVGLWSGGWGTETEVCPNAQPEVQRIGRHFIP